MTATTRGRDRPVTVYVTAQMVGLLFALAAGLALLETGVPVWGAAVCWLLVSAYLSRKRLPSEALGSALQFGAGLAVLAPAAQYLSAAAGGAEVRAVAVARDLFAPALVLVVFAGLAYVVGLVLKRRAERKLARRARKGVYRIG